MDSNDSLSIIHKKARVAREGFDARAMSPAKALRVSLAKTADVALDLALTVSTLEQTVVSTDGLLSKLDEQGLLILLDGAGGTRGVAVFDCQLVSAIIEKQIAGHVRKGEATPRSYTRTDAAMVAPILDATLEGFDARLEAHVDGHTPGVFRFGDKVEDARAMSLMLESGRFDLFRLTVELEEGAKIGVLMVALPCRNPVPNPVDSSDEGAPPRQSSLEKLALDATVTLTTVVARLNLPLHEICALKPDMTLPVSASSLGESQLVAHPGHVVADVHLGQVDGMRAVRIMLPGTGPNARVDQSHQKHVHPSDVAENAKPPIDPPDIDEGDLPGPLPPLDAPLQETPESPVDIEPLNPLPALSMSGDA